MLAVAINTYVPLVSVYGTTDYTVAQGQSVTLTVFSDRYVTWYLDDHVVIGDGSMYHTPTDLSIGLHEVEAADSTGVNVVFTVNVVPYDPTSPTSTPYPTASPTPYNPNPTVTPTKTWVDGEITPLQYWLGNNMVTLSLAATALIGGVFFLMYMKRGGRLR